jgi:hypothetical protein
MILQERSTQAYNNYEIKKYHAFTLPNDLYRIQWLGFMEKKGSLGVCKTTKFLERVNDNQFFRRSVNFSVKKLL